MVIFFVSFDSEFLNSIISGVALQTFMEIFGPGILPGDIHKDSVGVASFF